MHRRLALLAALAVSLGVSGCLYAAPALVPALSDDGGSGAPPSENVATVEAPSVARSSPSEATVSFVVRGDANGTVLLAVESDAAAAPAASAGPAAAPPFRPVTLVTGTAGVEIVLLGGRTYARVRTAPAGLAHAVTWSLVADGITGGASLRVRVIQVAADGAYIPGATERAGATPAAVRIGNDPPSLAVAASFDSTLSGTVALPFDLHDSFADPVSVVGEFSLDGGASFHLASTPLSALVNLLSADPADPSLPFRHTLVWDSRADTATASHQGTVVFRIRPSDALDEGPPGSVSFALDNNEAPRAESVALASLARVVSGTADVAYALVDEEGDPASIAVTFEREGSGAGGPATAAGGDGTAGLAASPAGAPHRFVWDYARDLGGMGAARVRVRVQPFDPQGEPGAAGTSGLLVVGNDPPVAAITSVPDPVAGNAAIAFTLHDSSGDLASVEVEYSTDGVTFRSASSGSATGGLATGAPGDPASPARHTFVWGSATDLPDVALAQVTLRITPDDGLAGGSGRPATRTVALDNRGDAPPTLTLAAPALARAGLRDGSGAPSAHAIAIDYALAEVRSTSLDVTVEWRREAAGPETFAPASEAAGSDGTSALASSPAGTSHRFVWAAGTDLAGAGLVEEDVVLRLTPRRVGVAGLAREVRLRAGNRPPVPAIVPASGAQGRTVVTGFTVADTAGDAARVSLTVQDVAGGGAPALVASLLGAGGTTTSIAATPGGARGDIGWDSLALSGVRNVSPARLVITATDAFGAVGTAMADIEVRNDSIGSAQILSVGTASGIAPVEGRIPVTFALFDPDADLDPQGPSGRPGVRVEVARPGEAFRPATGLALLDGGRLRGLRDLSALRARPFAPLAKGADNVHTFLWDARADDLGGVGPLDVRIRVTPLFGSAEGAADTATTRLGEAASLFGSANRLTQMAPELAAAQLPPPLPPRSLLF